ncbi:DgyrCDS7763 [Dimorphilus gyrociliatus]|uniref:DgyrCDS7763 n=1 Tax=Dimorphilus gyrociliatus TaxID=2664684 RepID=A0A7I8VS76_9ANNE|nr:DgyrCDS7763 [Dimorphilus gyrociliatus]
MYYYWVGYRDLSLKGDWRWTAGDLEYKTSDSNLWKTKPGNYNLGQCAVAEGNFNHKLSPQSCSSKKYFLCEYRLNSYDYGFDFQKSFDVITNKALYVVTQTQKTSLSDCAMKCLISSTCKSFNYQPSTRTCKLLTKSAYTDPSLMKTYSGVSHYINKLRKYDHCPKGAIPDARNDRCYLMYTSTKKYSDAIKECDHKKGTLAILDDAAYETFRNYPGYFTSVYWINANDEQSEGKWSFTWDKKQINYDAKNLKWKSGEPNGNTRENCAWYHGGSKVLQDSSCSEKKRYICQFWSGSTKPQGQPTSPSSNYDLSPGYLSDKDDYSYYVSSQEACMDKCDKWSSCKSFDYRKSNRRCSLSRNSKKTLPHKMSSSSSYVHGVNKARMDKDNPDYHIFNNRYLKDNNFKDYSNLYTYFDCLAKCEENRDCKSFDYDHNRLKCYLSKISKRSPGVQFNSHNDMIYGENKKRLGDVTTPPTNEPEPTRCDKYWIPYEGHCYYFGNQKKTQTRASSTCQAYDANLADIYSEAEMNFVVKHLKTSEDYWIGLQKKSGKYFWMNGKEAQYKAWKSSEPDGSGPCVRIGDKKWKDMYCSKSYRFVCKKQSSRNCDAAVASRVLCGYSGISQAHCINLGCCYSATGSIKCFKSVQGQSDEYKHCPTGSIKIPGTKRCVKYFSTSLDWYSAKSACWKNGRGYLVVPSTSNMFNQLTKLLKLSSGTYWMGLHDRYKEGRFEWILGCQKRTVSGRTYWNTNQPSRSNTLDCGYATSSNHKWNIGRCSDKRGFVCEYRGRNDYRIDIDCPTGWKTYGGKCYRVSTDTKSQSDANELCKAAGGTLASISNSDESNFVQKILQEATVSSKAWIGLKKTGSSSGNTGGWHGWGWGWGWGTSSQSSGNQWRWFDGTKYGSYKNWLRSSEEAETVLSKACAAFLSVGNDAGEWESIDCGTRVRYVCEARVDYIRSTDCKTGKLKCGSGARCIDDRGGSRCVCQGGRTPKIIGGVLSCGIAGECRASGDPHYRTFDKAMIHFQGTCKYTLAKPCTDKVGTLPKFDVEVKNEHRSSKKVAHTKIVDVKVYGYTIRLMKNRVVLVNGIRVNPTVEYLDGKLKVVLQCGYRLVVSTDFGLQVSFERNHMAVVKLPAQYQNKMCGLCGNWNGNARDDYYPKGLSVKKPYFEIGNSWEVPDDTTNSANEQCLKPEDDDDVSCTTAEMAEYEGNNFCGRLKNMEAFKACHASTPITDHFESCKMDVCAAQGKITDLCQSLQSYADSCKANGIEVSWRTATFCPLPCGPNMHYEANAPACPSTCQDPEAPKTCTVAPSDGCVCNPGFVQSGTDCVPETECGCMTADGMYKQLGETWGDSQCGTKYTCSQGGEIKEDQVVCHTLAECGIEDGERKCKCKSGYAGDGQTYCEDINECKTVSSDDDQIAAVCPPEAECKNKVGGYDCICRKGFVNKDNKCEDVDECKQTPSVCPHKCVNIIGSYKCECNDGFRMENGAKVCKDVNECQLKTDDCPPNSYCINRIGGFTCRCRRGYQKRLINGKLSCSRSAWCKGSGDPHYKTFDGAKIDFMGICRYTLVKPCPKSEKVSVPMFNVEVKNEHRGRKTTVSYTKYVVVQVYGYEIKLDQKRKVIISTLKKIDTGFVAENPKAYNLPIKALAGAPGLLIKFSGRFVKLTTTFGLQVSFDGRSSVYVKIPDIYKNIGMCGLCGNYNGNRNDDYSDSNGNIVVPDIVTFDRRGRKITRRRYSKIGNSWEVPDQYGEAACKKPDDPQPNCDEDEMAEISGNNKCGIIKNVQGPFKDCINILNSQDPSLVNDLYEECTYDLCLAKTDDMLCKALETLAVLCEQQAGKNVLWRRANFCPLPCGPNSSYSPTSSSCPLTCANPDDNPDNCDAEPVEGCQCNTGYVLSGDKCVKEDQCGCTAPDDRYFSVGDGYITNDCKYKYVCQANGKFSKTSLPACPSLAICKIKDGVRGCHCPKGYEMIAGKCTNIDECANDDLNKCHEKATCRDKVGTYECTCNAGYTGDGIICTEVIPCDPGYKRKVLPNGPCEDINECLSKPCGANMKCINKPGRYFCVCYPGFTLINDKGVKKCEKAAWCQASGDPHYKTFDGARLDFMGTCKYTLAEPCPKEEQENLPNFKVFARNWKYPGRRNRDVSWTKYVDIEVFGYKIRLDQGLKIIVNGRRIIRSFRDRAKGLKIYKKRRGRRSYAVVKTTFGLVVTFDGRTNTQIHIPPNYKNKMCGICGDFNGDKTNDYRDKAGNPVPGKPHGRRGKKRYPQLGNSYEVPCDDCPKHCKPPTEPGPECTDAEYAEAKRLCSIIKDSTGVFSQCIAKPNIDAITFYDECVYDLCIVNDEQTVSLCSAVEKFVEACNNVIDNYNPDWREEANCPTDCPANMEYKKNAPGCPPTCEHPNGDPNCDEPDVDSCVCKTGFVMIDNECVLPSNCNTDCTGADGTIYKLGEKWLQEDCKKRCECKPGQKAECSNFPGCTGDNEICSNSEGIQKCSCKSGYEMQDDGSCTDINECDDGSDKCSNNADCFNESPGYSCVCKPGFQGDGFECKEPPPCPNGYRRNSDLKCEDINECNENLHTCHNEAECTNKPGTYECKCKDGFKGDGKDKCDDINECDTVDCGPNASCVNDIGTYDCICHSGFQMNDKKECIDIDECSGTHDCDENANCINAQGSYTCECKAGYEGDGTQCTLIPPTTTLPPTTTQAPIQCPDDCQFKENICMCIRKDCAEHGMKPLSIVDEATNILAESFLQERNIQNVFIGLTLDGIGKSVFTWADGSKWSLENRENLFDDFGVNQPIFNNPILTCVIMSNAVLYVDWRSFPCSLPFEYLCEYEGSEPTTTPEPITCQPGFENIDGVCQNINECTNGDNDCAPEPAGKCLDTPGGYHCLCINPYKGDGKVCTLPATTTATTTVTTTTPGADCEDTEIGVNGQCISVENDCYSKGKKPIMIKSKAIEEALQRLMDATNQRLGYIGINKINGEWIWRDNSPLDYSSFDTSGTNAPPQMSCAIANGEIGVMKWQAFLCSLSHFPFFCTRDPTETVAPTTPKTCSPGYQLVDGDCIDIDECLSNPCQGPPISICSNKPGTFECACLPPYEKIGDECVAPTTTMTTTTEAPTTTTSSVQCEESEMGVNDKCISIEDDCYTKAKKPVIIENRQTQLAVSSFLRLNNIQSGYIGLEKDANKWKWWNNEYLGSYNAWKPGTFHLPFFACVIEAVNEDGQTYNWKPFFCNTPNVKYICERDPLATTPISTTPKECGSGYELVAGECVDINECITNNQCQSPPIAICKNIPGSYECICIPPYVPGDGQCVIKSTTSTSTEASTQTSPTTTGLCTDDEIESRDHCLSIADDCESESKKPVIIKSQAAEDAVQRLLRKNNIDYAFIGLQRRPISWKWHDGSSLNEYENWYNPLIATIPLKCAVEREFNGKYYWAVLSCNSPNVKYICERDPFAPTEPLTCSEGSEMVNGKCVDINECERALHKCNDNAICLNSEPGYSCMCKDGYIGNGYFCIPKQPTTTLTTTEQPHEEKWDKIYFSENILC